MYRNIDLAGPFKTMNVMTTCFPGVFSPHRQLYQSLNLSILLYGAETWTNKNDDENRLNVFEMSCLRRILGVRTLDKIRNSHIKQSLNLKTSVTDKVSKKRLKYFGHAARMPPHRNPQIALEDQVQGIRPRGRPPKKWFDCLANYCEERSIKSLYQAGRSALNRKNLAASTNAEAITG